MADPFVAEIRILACNFAPKGWAFCDGQLLPISQNTALFSLLGTNYGGNGQSTFGLPNLQGAAPLGWGQGPGLSSRSLGEKGGAKEVTLVEAQLPGHGHGAIGAATSVGTLSDPTGNVWAAAAAPPSGTNLYSGAAGATMGAAAMSPGGSSLPHNNMPPYLAMNFCIAMQGVYPPHS